WREYLSAGLVALLSLSRGCPRALSLRYVPPAEADGSRLPEGALPDLSRFASNGLRFRVLGLRIQRQGYVRLRCWWRVPFGRRRRVRIGHGEPTSKVHANDPGNSG